MSIAKAMRMRGAVLAAGLGISALGVLAVPSAALADTTCVYPFTNCTPTNGPDNGTAVVNSGTLTAPPTASTSSIPTASSSSLAFTGADIEELSAIGGAAIIAGGFLVRRSRRRRVIA
jgi:hypothetical protein